MDLPLNDTPIVHAREQAEIIRACAENDMDYVEQRYFGGARIFTGYVDEKTYPVFDYATRLEALNEAELRDVLRTGLAASVKGSQRACVGSVLTGSNAASDGA